MAQRLVSSMRPTTYASAATCRHMMVLPWKHKSYLPPFRAISWTNPEKGSFLIRSSVLFWNCQISQRATVPGQYFLVFLTFPAWRKSLQGVLPPTVGQSFLLTGFSLPKADGPTSAAIWANCWVSNNDEDLPTSSSLLASSTHFSASSPPLLWARASWLGMGDELERGASFLSPLELSLLLWSREPTFPHLFHLFSALFWFLPYCKTIGKHQPMEN